MKSSSISHAKNNLSALIDQVRAGNSILITDRNKAVAKLVPVEAGDTTEEQQLAELERKGLITRGKGRISPEFLTRPLPSLPEGQSLSNAVIEERREGW